MNAREIIELLGRHYGEEPSQELGAALSTYLALLQKWNARTNLTAVRSDQEIVLRHFGESLLCARSLPEGAETLLDFGSGAGFPGAVCAIARVQLRVCLAEAQSKKAAFLMELSRHLGVAFEVHAGRVEALALTRLFDAVTLRAVDHMQQACMAALPRVRIGGALVLLTTQEAFASLRNALPAMAWQSPILVQGSEQRVIAIGIRGE